MKKQYKLLLFELYHASVKHDKCFNANNNNNTNNNNNSNNNNNNNNNKFL